MPRDPVVDIVQGTSNRARSVMVDVAVGLYATFGDASNTGQDALDSWIGFGLGLSLLFFRLRRRHGPRSGASGIAIAKRLAGGGARGEHELRAVDSTPGALVDHHRFGLCAGVGVYEHHAALPGCQSMVAPRREDHDHRTQRVAEVGEDVFIARRMGVVLTPLEDPIGD